MTLVDALELEVGFELGLELVEYRNHHH